MHGQKSCWGLVFGCLALSACGSAPATSEPAKAPSESRPSANVSATVAPAAPETQAAPPAPFDYGAIVDAPDRSPTDRQLDSGRHPEELLAFAEITPGMRVAELAAGGGYTAELLARTVGAEGAVFGQNTPFILERFAQKPWTERLKKPVMKTVTSIESEFDTPLPNHVHSLDAVFLVLFYHDTVWMKVDRDSLNRNVFNALKPGGVYVVVDHSARPGEGTSNAETLHRIEEGVVIEEVKRAGFQLDATAEFLRNREDTRDWNASPRAAGSRRGTSDRFTLRFVKPL